MRERYLVEKAFNHVFNRGNRKRVVFQDEEDYRVFLEYVEQNCEKWNVNVVTYSLLPNHYHLVLQQLEGNNLSKFMHCVGTSFSMYINNKYGLVGHVFQGRYKSKLIDSQRMLNAEIEYVINNPVKHGLVDNPEDYKWVQVQPRIL